MRRQQGDCESPVICASSPVVRRAFCWRAASSWRSVSSDSTRIKKPPIDSLWTKLCVDEKTVGMTILRTKNPGLALAFSTDFFMTTPTTSLFSHVPPYEGDPILSLMEAFQADPRPHKVSLSIGVYFDGEGRLPVLPSVRQAETALSQDIGARPYLPIEGIADFRAAVQRLLFGAGHEAVASGRIATLQTLGGSG